MNVYLCETWFEILLIVCNLLLSDNSKPPDGKNDGFNMKAGLKFFTVIQATVLCLPT